MSGSGKTTMIKDTGEEDPSIRQKNEIIRQRQNINSLQEIYNKLTIETKILSIELKMYQERIGLLHMDEGILEDVQEDPILAQLGLKKAQAPMIIGGYFDYITPLMMAYKHKITILDDHLRDNYRRIIKYQNDIEKQEEMQDKLLKDIESKQEDVLKYQDNISEDYNIEFDFMDHVSREDLYDRIHSLKQQNEESEIVLRDLKENESRISAELKRARDETARLRQEVSDKQDQNLNHEIEKLEKENSILSQKYIEISETNSQLEGARIQLRNQIEDLQREKSALESRFKAEEERDRKHESELESKKDKNTRELEKLEDQKRKDQKRIEVLDHEIGSKETKLNELRLQIQNKERDRQELEDIWNKLRSDYDLLQKKKQEYKQVLEEHKIKMKEVNLIGQMERTRQGQFQQQKDELERNHQEKLEFIMKEHARRKTREEERYKSEYSSKQRVLDNLKDRVSLLEKKEGEYVMKIDSLKKESTIYREFELDEAKTMDTIKSLEGQLVDAQRLLKEKEEFIKLADSGDVDLNQLNKENKDLDQQIATINAQKKQLESEISRTKAYIESITTKISQKQESLKATINEKYMQNTTTENALRNQITELKARIAAKKDVLSNSMREAQRNEAELTNSLAQKKAQVTQILESQNSQISALQAQLKALSSS